jgi:hypothetical protein
MRVKVSLKPGDSPKSEHLNRSDWEGDAENIEAGIKVWKSQNGLDGIGTDNWPLEAVEVAPEKVVKPVKVAPVPVS